MTGPDSFGLWAAAVLLICFALLVLLRPLLALLRLALRSSLGLALLALLSPIGPLVGVRLGVNLVNALVLGLLGAPGFGLLLMLQWALK